MNDGTELKYWQFSFANKENLKLQEGKIFADVNDELYYDRALEQWLNSPLPRHCANNCEPAASEMSRSCVCRKRKEHEEDFYEADWKFSKSSDRSGGDGNSMILLMKKWSNNEVVKGEEGPVVQPDSDYKASY